MTASVAVPDRSRGLEGENLETIHWEDARHWIAVSADLPRFKTPLLDRVRRELAELIPEAQQAASEDISLIESQMRGYEIRLDLWYQRLWQLHGLDLDADGPMIRHGGREEHMIKREFQLLEFLIDHPNRWFTATQLLTRSWSDPTLSPEEVRNYVRRLRTLLAKLEVPCDLVNRPGRGYSLVYANDT